MKGHVYVRYSRKHPYLPIAIADTAKELARMLGVTENTVYSSITKKHGTYAKVYISDDDGSEQWIRKT